jgi:catechol 2,3-dioxygenase-like lactoylglutathione lyase family enzyme
MPVEYLQIVSVPVSSQDRAREFYVQGLGWELLSDEDTSLPGGSGSAGWRCARVAARRRSLWSLRTAR